jgi:MFS family permease
MELGSCFEGGLLHSLASTFSQRQHLWMLMMLLLIDSSRSFFVCGSSYLWKDLFSLHDGASVVSPSALNTITGVAPLVGLFVGDMIVRTFGVRRTCSVASLLAALSLVLLTSEGLRKVPWMLLFLIMAVKLTYGPLATCVSLLKLEAFPTEVRASTFALVSMMGKLFALVAPTAAEVLRGGPSADDWAWANLMGYMGCLVGASLLTGAFVLLVDRGVEEHAPLEDSDPLGEHRAVDMSPADKVDKSPLGSPTDRASRCSSGFGSFFDIWAPGSPGTPSSRAGAFDNWMPRLPDSPASPSSRWGPLEPLQSPRTPVGAPPRIIHS